MLEKSSKMSALKLIFDETGWSDDSAELQRISASGVTF
jgi:hypothetical protein